MLTNEQYEKVIKKIVDINVEITDVCQQLYYSINELSMMIRFPEETEEEDENVT